MSSLNKLTMDERVEAGKVREDNLLLSLSNIDSLFGREIKYWKSSTRSEDMQDKVDVWVKCEGEPELSVQLKTRDDKKPDLGLALIRPYSNRDIFKSQFESNTIPWDRDMKGDIDLYVCELNDKIYIVNAERVKDACYRLLYRLYKAPAGFMENSYAHPSVDGAELRLVFDKGKGYSYKQHKIICYLQPDLLIELGAEVYVSK